MDGIGLNYIKIVTFDSLLKIHTLERSIFTAIVLAVDIICPIHFHLTGNYYKS